jgi:hypothetical protein
MPAIKIPLVQQKYKASGDIVGTGSSPRVPESRRGLRRARFDEFMKV